MAQTMHVNGNGPEKPQQCPSTETEKDPYYVETPYGYQLDLDFLKYVNDIERGNTIKKLSIQRKPKKPLSVPRGSTGGGSTQAEWTSTDSLSSSNSDDKQSPVFFNPRSQTSAPPTPTLSRQAACEVPLQQPFLNITEQKQLLPPPSPRFNPRHNPQVERTLMETRLRLEQERLLMQPHVDPPMPRRRLASFGGMGSSSSLSSHSSSILHSQISPNAPAFPINGHPHNGEYNPYYPASMGSSIRHSPLSSGMTTPVTNVSPLHLHQIREQMVVALRRLKELEEQVKTIPILQVKIAVLQEEKRQMAAQSKNQGPGGFRKRSYSVGSADQMENPGPVQKEPELHIREPEAQEQSSQCLEEFRRLAAEVQALEKTTRENKINEVHSHKVLQNQAHQKSIGIVTDENMNNLPVPHGKLTNGHCLRDAGVSTERPDTRSVALAVTEAMLGVTSEAEKEVELQHQAIEALKEKIYRLEVQLKETTHEMEMGKLKLELQAAGGSNKKKADKGFMVRPETYNVYVEAKVQMRTQGVGNHLEFNHANAAKSSQTCSVGVSCVASGPEIPMDRWSVRELVEVKDQCVGRRMETCDQQVGVEQNVCEVGVNTEESMDSLVLCKAKLSKESRSVGCGDCSVDVIVSPVKALVSRGTDPDLIGKVDLGVMAAPESANQQTSTDLEVASKSTNTKTAVLTDSFTDMTFITCDKQTSTAAIETRTVAAGEGLVKDVNSSAKARSVAVGTTTDMESFLGKSSCSAKTKESGVGAVSIHDNFLVGRNTRNIACGPSQPAGSPTSKEATEVKASPAPAQAQECPGLDHYIGRVQKLLQEQQMLLAENYSELADAFGQPQSQFGSINSQLVSTLSSINTVMKSGSTEDILKLQSDSVNLNKESSENLSSQLRSEKTTSEPNSAEPPKNSPAQQHFSASTAQKSSMDLQMSTALHGQPSSQSALKSIMKKKDGKADANGTKKNLQFVGVNGGYETTSSDDSSSEDSSSSGSDEEEEEEEKEWEDKEELKDVEGKSTGEEFQSEGVENVDKKDENECSEKQGIRERYKPSEKMLAACNVLKTHLCDPKAVGSKDLRACVNTVQHEWFRVSSQKTALAAMVEDYLSAFRDVSPDVLHHIANMADGNGNTALHYSVSHSNFHVVKKLLDADVCNVNQQNKAGYTPIMLATLAAVDTPKDMRTVQELFSKGDVNARASQAGQTGLMLAVSHGRMDMVQALLAHGADVNIQDDEGSTALMCASEHGHVEIVKLLLAQPGCDATLSDSDESNALSIALEAGHKDIAVLLYAHVNFSKAQSPGTPRLGRKMSPSPTRRSMFD
ncbi:KN motif and ankyrin repeat domain-containing protein 1a isoform X1 [Takifugu flavidus]|uniref:KN motif and ankyrin repeat domain-containing protein 1 n=2 Tax=Takifugu flavidus TaxID=433684 RepID=A0A5C6MYE7_9TELE|nr:KN motif and ankyrin repeat domain-containing protein 1a isoform X1 [Takifugu flavidus]XP_056888186.1 KN motif and ankyrin repeat domain-containing protein 1a isoform X1 [Takifugu flavidus]XP_056888187.1 KN motif and ankyrin repeat domain-containing protein 1a isoform X1 [Takifugu flavidus]XP_056888188.1 KN motif and ankyrin repeat domain-containing protein 1a isoform X1 [Takifugu flavidus]XP_056888189.1 KN motif and ankyrin repeat domain-containing protein 1a isoform X1 [Takifugu flavidus]